MRLETGSNIDSAYKKVSIQVKLGGLSFSASKVSTGDAKQLLFVIDTPRVTLAPREDVTLDNATELLRIAGKECRLNEQTVCSELQDDIVAIIAIDKKALASITERWGSQASFTSPLLDMSHSEEACLSISASEKVCYMRLFGEGMKLQRAEAFEATTPEDILYLVAKWTKNNDIPIYIDKSGDCSSAKLLNKYYKRVKCE